MHELCLIPETEREIGEGRGEKNNTGRYEGVYACKDKSCMSVKCVAVGREPESHISGREVRAKGGRKLRHRACVKREAGKLPYLFSF